MKRFASLAAAVLVVGVLAAALALQQPPSSTSPIPDGPRYWKGNLHTHSLWSDGDDYPEMIADWYKQHGYQFLAMTDHNRLSDGERWINVGEKDVGFKGLAKYRKRFGPNWVEERMLKDKPQVRLKPLNEFRTLVDEAGKFLMIPGEEITHQYAKAPIHINAINVRDVLKPVDGADPTETIRVNHRIVAEQSRKTGWKMIAILNHPNFGWGVRAEEMVMADELKYFEVFNGHPGVRNYGDPTHASCERIWDVLLALRLGKHNLPIIYGVATDDSHAYHAWGLGKVNPGRGWIMVRAPQLSPEAILRAMEVGDFYGSTGVVLDDVQREGGRLALSIRAEAGVTYKTQFIATMKDARLDSEPRVDKDGKELRVTRIYPEDVGRVVAEMEGTTPSYKLSGSEIYVRAKVVSSKPHPNPYAKGDTEMAWTQPVVPERP